MALYLQPDFCIFYINDNIYNQDIESKKLQFMKKYFLLNIKGLFFIGLLFVLVSFANNMFDEHTIKTVPIAPVVHHYQYVPTQVELQKQNITKEIAKVPFVEKDFVGFKEALAFKESQGNYNRVNTLGYLGKYQFGKSTLRELKINPKGFLKKPLLQEKAFLANLEKNKWILRKEIKKYSGKWINGVKITESGILAAAHLGGAGAVQQFLWSYGKKTMKDAYGTRIEHYLRKFSGYDLSKIKPKKRPVIDLE